MVRSRAVSVDGYSLHGLHASLKVLVGGNRTSGGWMTAWNKITVLEWFRHHVGKRVALRQPSTLLRVVGTIHDVHELDACSADFHTVDFECGLDDVQVSLSFHDANVSLHLLAKPLHHVEASLSVPISIPYAELDLAPAEEKKRQDEPGFSPYELLR